MAYHNIRASFTFLIWILEIINCMRHSYVSPDQPKNIFLNLEYIVFPKIKKSHFFNAQI